jgi:hypothetical protein
MRRPVCLASILALMAVPACTSTPSTMGDPDAARVTDTGIGSVDAARADDTGGPIDAGHDAFVALDAPAPDAAAIDASGPDTGPIADAGGSLHACGGRTGHTCAPPEYCDYDGAPCGTTDGAGVCRSRPTVCAPDTTAVCGCDSVDYASACAAAMAGTDVSSTGSCGTSSMFACGTMFCERAMTYCQVTMGGPPPGHTSYACLPLPAPCTGGAATPTCATCFGSGASMCVDGAPGEITVTRLTP